MKNRGEFVRTALAGAARLTFSRYAVIPAAARFEEARTLQWQ